MEKTSEEVSAQTDRDEKEETQVCIMLEISYCSFWYFIIFLGILGNCLKFFKFLISGLCQRGIFVVHEFSLDCRGLMYNEN